MNLIVSTIIIHGIGALRAQMVQFCVLVPPIFFAVLLSYLYRSNPPGEAAALAGAGASLLSIWTILTFTALIAVDTEKIDGTLAATFVAPTRFEFSLLLRSVGFLCVAFLSVPVAFITSSLLIGEIPAFSHITVSLLGFITFSICATSFAFFVGTFVALTRVARVIMNFVEYPIYIFSGIVIPVSNFPAFLRFVSYFVPFSHPSTLVNASILGNHTNQQILSALFAAVITAVSSYALSVIVARQIRVEGRLDLA